MNKKIATLLSMFVLSFIAGYAANTKQTVNSVSSVVTITDDVDYIISNASPFTDDGVVDIVNTEHAVLILSQVKPSAAIKLLASHVKINGETAKNNSNCQVKLYNRGAIIMPYANGIKPLTVYSEPNFGGESVNDFGLENDGGYMNTLTEAKLNNRIQSFKLKRGYMVTFSTRAGGRGYSRCFIAADKDLEIAEMPAILNKTISSYRVFKWYDAGKKHIASDTRKEVLDALNVQSCYDWGQGNSSLLPDYEWVPNHIYEDWPSSATIGGTSQSPHTKNNNEPRNPSDDRPQDLTTILGNWENMMRTGLRLCSPASWDGSDYWNATGFLAEFLDSIDARGWRCDIIDLHCYWAEGSFDNMHYWTDKYHRPIWISEWVWGASWNNNGAFANGVTEAQNAAALKRICPKLNSWDYVERYYYWNSERDPSRIYKDGQLTEAGKYYASLDAGIAYNGKYDFVPTTPKQYRISNFKVEVKDGKAIITWHDSNGEYNRVMALQRKQQGGQWETLSGINQQELAADYTYTDETYTEGTKYRVRLIDVNGKESSTSTGVDPGEVITTDDGQQMYAGGNLLVNGDFDLGMNGWTNAKGTALTMPAFQVVAKGGDDDGCYLHAYQGSTKDSESSVGTVVNIKPGLNYFFQLTTKNGNASYNKLSLSKDGSEESQTVGTAKASSDWTTSSGTFNSSTYDKILFSFRWLNNVGFDKIELRQLFATREAAIADALEKARLRAEAVKAYNTEAPALNTELDSKLSAISSTTPSDADLALAENAINALLQALKDKEAIDSLTNIVSALRMTGIALPEELNMEWAVAPEHWTADYFTSHKNLLQQTLNDFITYSPSSTQPKSGNFSSSTGWEVKVGTYKGGDQQVYTKNNHKCWNARWSGLSASTGKTNTMEIRQEVTGLKEEGIYVMQCKATTEHYCLSDQHGYMVVNGDTAVTSILTADYLDLLSGDNVWQTLTTTPVYIPEGGSVTIGFTGSKQGAIDNAWHQVGTFSNSDKREGWWCATDFTLLFNPVHKMRTTINEWHSICLPYAFTIPEGVHLYEQAGMLSDQHAIALKEVFETEAGVPYIYRTETPEMTLFEYGEAASSSVTKNNLRGFFTTASSVPVNGYILRNNQWELVTDRNNRPKIESYTAIIQKLDGITLLDSWDGPTLPLVDVTDGLERPTNENDAATAKYTLSGQSTQQPHGVYIEMNDGKAHKRIAK